MKESDDMPQIYLAKQVVSLWSKLSLSQILYKAFSYFI